MAAPRPPLPAGPFLVLGLARSGEAAALALKARGEAVIGADSGPAERPPLAHAARRLREAGVEVHTDVSDDRLLADARVLVKSPGVPHSAPLVQAARAAGLPVLGELELAWRLIPNDFIAVTGTNGKTTTTEWVGHVHRTAGAPVAVAGNVGTALSTLIGTLPAEATVVCEASSFQLEDTLAFAPEAATLLNVTPDHLDRHGSFKNYVEAKRQAFAHQRPDQVAVLPDDLGFELGGDAARMLFGNSERAALRRVDGELRWHGEPLVRTDEVALPGAHNLQNAMATAAICLARGLGREAVAEGLRSFGGVPHRLELVAEVGGVRYVNDSKATNVASTIVALRSFGGDVHLIAGGQGKAQDFSALAPLVAGRCAAVYLIGADGDQIGAALAGTGVPLIEAGDLETAVEIAGQRAGDGAVILLSPACASFDQFRDFEARGERFRELAQAREA
jgi:UDP-N-acetylmuramoylalanine--D-glutamate ligase